MKQEIPNWKVILLGIAILGPAVFFGKLFWSWQAEVSGDEVQKKGPWKGGELGRVEERKGRPGTKIRSRGQGENQGEITIEKPGVAVNMPLLTWPGGRR